MLVLSFFLLLCEQSLSVQPSVPETRLTTLEAEVFKKKSVVWHPIDSRFVELYGPDVAENIREERGGILLANVKHDMG